MLESLKEDIRARNLTIYAQWLAILGVISIWISEIHFLVAFLPFLGIFGGSMQAFYVLKSIVVLFVHPLAPLVLELPHFIRRVPFFYLSILSFVPLFVGNIFILGKDVEFENFFWHTALPFLLIPINCWFIMAMYSSSVPSMLFRTGMYLLYAVQMGICTGPFTLWLRNKGRESGSFKTSFWGGTKFDFGLPFCVSLVFFATSILYLAALLKDHRWKGSVLLGGTGIEAMVLMIPGQGPVYQSIGDEAEGRIQLV